MDATRRATALLLTLTVLAAAGCKNHVVYRKQGYTDYRNQDFGGAAENFRAAVDQKPSDFKSQYYLGASLLKLDQPLAAQTPLEQALAVQGQDPEWAPKIADLLAESYYRQGRTQTLYAFLDDTIQTYGQQPGDYLRKAHYLGLSGDADGQKLALQKAAYFAPAGDVGPYLAIAAFYRSVNDVPNAIQALRFGYHVAPEDPEVSNGLRALGIVPGPTVAAEPPKPGLLD